MYYVYVLEQGKTEIWARIGRAMTRADACYWCARIQEISPSDRPFVGE